MMALSYLQEAFGQHLLKWHRHNPRPLPWKETNDPYKIWLSEIILQQTQVSQGIPYYHRFIEAFPTVEDLAAASQKDVLKLWQGLGYNSRARNLHKAATTVAEKHNGYFPTTSSSLQKLSGIGPYTAAAIASFAFGEHVPVVDTNVIRVVCRLLAIDEAATKAAVKKRIVEFLSAAMKGHDPAAFNQAIMNFGALQCTPKRPDCNSCPMAEFCEARRLEIAEDLPVKPAKRPRRNRYFHYLVIHNESHILLRKRTGDDIWKGMYDFPLIETQSSERISKKRIAQHESTRELLGRATFRIHTNSIHAENQILSHQKIHCLFYPIFVKDMLPDRNDDESYMVVSHGEEENYPVPKVVDCYFRVKSIFL